MSLEGDVHTSADGGRSPQRFFGEVGDRVGALPIIPPTPLAPGPEP